MATHHVKKEVVISYDIKNYFDSIHQDLLIEIFQHLGIEKSPAFILAEACTYKFFLPQGALTSPKLSNIVAAATFGPLVKKFCDDKKYTLTIFADDLTISSDSRLESGDITELHSVVRDALQQFGFKVNQKKTKIMSKTRRQYVCGCVVNEKVNMLKNERLLLRAIVHNVTKTGVEENATKSNSESPEKFIQELKGRLNWFKQLNEVQAVKLIAKLDTYLKANPLQKQTEAVLPTPAAA